AVAAEVERVALRDAGLGLDVTPRHVVVGEDVRLVVDEDLDGALFGYSGGGRLGFGHVIPPTLLAIRSRTAYHELVIIATQRLRESQALCMVGPMDDATIGAQVRALRERAGFQSQELAKQVGIDPSAMSNIERRKRSLKSDELAKIAEALG